MTRPLVGLLLMLGSACTTPRASAPVPANEGQLQLALSLSTYPTQQPWTLASLKGQVVLLDVWATWCEPCREAMPFYQDLGRRYSSKGLHVVTINVDSDSKDIAGFLTENNIDLPVVLDPDAAVVESALHVKLMPTATLVDRRGVVRHVHEGFDSGAMATWVSQIESLLAEPAP
jgi:cytochrome c biogenesis protein CcmG, thiol:disulfide interchange protein DsbE